MLNEIKQGIKSAKSREDILISELERYGSKKAREKDKYSCVFCTSSDGLGVATKNNESFFRCFSCGCSGDVINLIKEKEPWTTRETLDYLEENYAIGWKMTGKAPTVAYRKPKVSEDKIKEHEEAKTTALVEGDLVTALREDREIEQLNNTSIVIFKDTGPKNEPLKTWENLEILLKTLNIIPVQNIITKGIELLGLDIKDYNNQVTHIHSECLKYGLYTSKDMIYSQIELIAENNKFNPAKDYLERCHFDWDEKTRIDELISTLKIEDSFPKELAHTLIIKWFLNAVNIAHNEGDKLTEGILVFQGKQGIGKTTWIKSLVPNDLFIEGKSLNPSNVDSVRQATNRWIVELGELDGTTKGEQSALKAYITNRTDTYRVPYAVKEKTVPRTTIYFGTVNEDSFLKDDTGSRRYWVIPITSIDWKKLEEIDKEQLWGEFYQMYLEGYKLNLTREELEMLNELNKEFTTISVTQSRLTEGFAWDTPRDTWAFMSTTEIMNHFNLKSNKGVKTTLERLGAEPKRERIKGSYLRGFIVPKFITPSDNYPFNN